MRLIDADALAAKYMGTPPDYYHTTQIVGEITAAPTVKQEPALWYGGVMRFEDDFTTYGEMYTLICETLMGAGVLDVRPASEERLVWVWKIKAVKLDDEADRG